MLTETICSYCLKSREEVGALVRSPLAAICLSCAERAVTLISEHTAPEDKWSLATFQSAMENEEILQRLPEVARAQDQVEEHLVSWVSFARRRSISWDRIGKALGMTRQSAWERFHKKITHRIN